jgi:hypothetical protein
VMVDTVTPPPSPPSRQLELLVCSSRMCGGITGCLV